MARQQDGMASTSRRKSSNVQSQPGPSRPGTAEFNNTPASQTNKDTTKNGTNNLPEGGEEEDQGEELAWGPSHPCFPHLNPHVPLSSPEYISTRIIRIRRDWMVAGDLAPTYSNIYPEILDPLLPEPEFRQILEHINTTLLTAFDPFSKWNWVDGVLGAATGWLWEDFRPMGVKKALRGLETWMENWNGRVGARNGVKLISLRRTGYLGLDVQIPDPQIRVVSEDESVSSDHDDDDDDDDDNDDDDDRTHPSRTNATSVGDSSRR